jgi:hypothetical protein
MALRLDQPGNLWLPYSLVDLIRKEQLGTIQVIALERDFQLGSAGLGDEIAGRNDHYC